MHREMLSGVRNNNRVPFPCSQDFLWLFVRCIGQPRKNVNCLVFLTLSCINIRCWIKSWSDCFPLWRRVWSSQPHLCCSILLLQYSFSATSCTFSGPDQLCRLAPAIDRVPEELWTEVHNTVQEAAIKTILKKKKWKKAKWLSKEALQKAEKWKEAKGKEKRKIYPSECRVPKNSK